MEGDDFNEPICDAVRAILDGHIVLSRQLAAAGHYPAIDVLHSVSRLEGELATDGQAKACRKIREALSVYQHSEDLIQLGAYVAGSNPKLDASIGLRGEMLEFLRQPSTLNVPRQETLDGPGKAGRGAAVSVATRRHGDAATRRRVGLAFPRRLGASAVILALDLSADREQLTFAAGNPIGVAVSPCRRVAVSS